MPLATSGQRRLRGCRSFFGAVWRGLRGAASPPFLEWAIDRLLGWIPFAARRVGGALVLEYLDDTLVASEQPPIIESRPTTDRHLDPASFLGHVI